MNCNVNVESTRTVPDESCIVVLLQVLIYISIKTKRAKYIIVYVSRIPEVWSSQNWKMLLPYTLQEDHGSDKGLHGGR